jgi:DNA-binding protein H-NS
MIIRRRLSTSQLVARQKICNSHLTDHIDIGGGIETEKEIMPRISSLKVIERQIRELEARAEALKHEEKPGLKQLKALVKKYRLTPCYLQLAVNGHGRRGLSKLAGRKLKPKYRNPANKTETWSGRGLQPKWLVTAMKSTGKKLDHFEI